MDSPPHTGRDWPVRERVTTTDPDEAHAWLEARYARHETLTLADPKGFHLSHAIVDFGQFAIARVEYTAPGQVFIEPMGSVFVHEVDHGHHEVDHGPDASAGPGELLLYPANMGLGARWSGGTVRRVVRLPAVGVAAVLGCQPRDIRFDSVKPLSSGTARGWRALTRHVTRSVLPEYGAGSELLRAATAQMLIATLLDTFPIAAPHRVPSVWGAEAVVVRARRFIEDNCHRPIGIPDIAAAARVSPSWLGEAFRQRLQMTPMGYLARVRMDAVHADLKRADPTQETVGEIAIRWGFAHGGRFAAQYRKRYGCSPSDTLRGS